MNTYSLSLTQDQINELLENTEKLNYENPPAYARYHLKGKGISIVIYNSNKVVFQGEKAQDYARPFIEDQELVLPQAGSDETGTGSYFGPVVVVACYIDRATYQKIKHFNLTDSKTLTDDLIVDIAPQLMDLVPHSLLLLDNYKYNQVQKNNNKNSILAKLHNKAYLNLMEKGIDLPNLTVIDQFVSSDRYFNYLKNEPEVFRGLTFKTKAESDYISVAVASIIARFIFLQTLEQMGQHYQFNFLSGAGQKVDLSGVQFVNRFGKKELQYVAKLHFANTEKIINNKK